MSGISFFELLTDLLKKNSHNFIDIQLCVKHPKFNRINKILFLHLFNSVFLGGFFWVFLVDVKYICLKISQTESLSNK